MQLPAALQLGPARSVFAFAAAAAGVPYVALRIVLGTQVLYLKVPVHLHRSNGLLVVC